MNVLASIKLISASAFIFADTDSKYKPVFKTFNQTQTLLETHSKKKNKNSKYNKYKHSHKHHILTENCKTRDSHLYGGDNFHYIKHIGQATGSG